MINKCLKTAVIIPVYNSAKSIRQVLESIENQTQKDAIAVVIVIDDGSSDDSVNIVEEFKVKSTIRVDVIEKENGGVSSARNAGLDILINKYPEIEWLCFCDSDDLWKPHKLERQLQVLNNNPTIDCLGTQYNESKLKISGRIVDNLVRGTVHDILIQNFPQPSTVIMRTRIIREIGGFDQSQKYAEDGNFFLRVAHDYNLYYLPECLIDYGFGKRAFGFSGLSANLKGMYNGNIKNLKDMKDLGYISNAFYCEMRIFHFLKYVRRIIITKLN